MREVGRLRDTGAAASGRMGGWRSSREDEGDSLGGDCWMDMGDGRFDFGDGWLDSDY